MKNLGILIASLLLCSLQLSSQNPTPKIELFSKHSVGFHSPSATNNLILDNTLSLYINSFGNTVECSSTTSVGGCLLVNIISIFSSYEIAAGFDTYLGEIAPVFRPKIGFYLRPFYYGKVGINFTSQNPMFSAGFTIPIKKIQLEFLYNDVHSYSKNTLGTSSRYQIGIMIPLH